MNRRDFLKTLGLSGIALSSGCQYMPRYGFTNPCYKTGLPKELREHKLLSATWEGIDTKQLWDCHTHLVGLGDSDSGIWINPNMKTILHPVLYTQFKLYINGSCAEPVTTETFDEAFVNRLLLLHKDMPKGFRFCLLAFDYYHNEKSEIVKEYSTFYTPNKYALKLATKYPDQFEWIASIHPYREDSLGELE
ncbi:MAG: amidohydrolase, partial [Thiohalomonadales bacterium]